MKTDGAETLPYARLPYLRLIPMSFRGRNAPVGIRPLHPPTVPAPYPRVIPRAQRARGNPSPFHVNSGQRPPPTFAAPRQRRDLIIAKTLGGVSKGEGRSPPSLVVSRGKDF